MLLQAEEAEKGTGSKIGRADIERYGDTGFILGQGGAGDFRDTAVIRKLVLQHCLAYSI